MHILLLALLALPARADEDQAETCLRTKIWDGYNTGYSVRTSTKATLNESGHKVYLVTLYAGNDYKVLACGDSNIGNADLVLYDHSGKQVAVDSSNDREPLLQYTPQVTDTYYIAVHASKLNDITKQGSISTAVTYK
ncbi:MAG: hypothetical protein EXR69_02245 [Myxococcales bacterium]|nr:hypothetical protein [Myxococcales bacterium]